MIRPFRTWQKMGLTSKIFTGMLLGTLLGLGLHYAGPFPYRDAVLIDGIFDMGGKIFITLLSMLVIPIVFVSLVNGTCNLGTGARVGRIAGKTMGLYLMTSTLAISTGLLIATWFEVGSGNQILQSTQFKSSAIPPVKDMLLDMFPNNPVKAMAAGNLMQVILFSILLGIAISAAGEQGKRIRHFFSDLDAVIMKLMHIILWLTPFGVFCLVTTIFAKLGYDLILQLIGYFGTVIIALAVHQLITYPIFIKMLANLSPVTFYRKLTPAMMFAFSTSSSNATIPVMMDVVEERLGVHNSISSFVIPLGATVNMDGTAIMQSVATVFIANIYQIDLGLSGYLMVLITATLAAIGTAGIPSVGLITLTMVLHQVGLPIEGIALIIGVDRLLDMSRTVVNVTGDAVVAAIVAKSENEFDEKVFNRVTVD